MRTTRLGAVLLCLLLTQSLGAAVVDRRPVSAPDGVLVAADPDRVVASENGLFLFRGQRILPGGVKLDEAPLVGADGYAVPWPDGWLVLNEHAGELFVRYLGAAGEPALLQRMPLEGTFVCAASLPNRLAIVERDAGYGATDIRVVVSDGQTILNRKAVGDFDAAVLSSFDGGFLLVTSNQVNGHASLKATRFDSDGNRVLIRTFDSIPGTSGRIAVSPIGDRALVTVGSRIRMLDASLTSTSVFDVTAPPQTFVNRTVPIARQDSWVVSYTFAGQIKEDRALVVRYDGTIEEDAPSQPIFAADRIADRYLVVDPSGEIAEAEGDPRDRSTSTIPVQQWQWRNWFRLAPVESGDVTLLLRLVYPGMQSFVRVDSAGTAVDPEPQRAPSAAVSAIPGGFVFAWHEESQVKIRRLASLDGWIDPEPITVAYGGAVLGLSINANGRDMLVAWSTADEFLWMRLGFDGTPLQSAPSRFARPYAAPPELSPWNVVRISERDGRRLLIGQDEFVCPVLCSAPPLWLEGVVLDEEGQMVAPAFALPSPMSAEPASLPDGSWVVPIRDADREFMVLHMSEDGSFLDLEPIQGAYDLPDGVRSTETGWKAIYRNPWRIQEFAGAAEPFRLIGLSRVNAPQFGAGDRLWFIDDSPAFESVSVPWTGRIETVEGNLSLGLTKLPASPTAVRVTVRNEGDSTATGTFVTSTELYRIEGSPIDVRPLRPGELTRFAAEMNSTDPLSQIWLLSDDVADADPSDNLLEFGDAASDTPRRRPVHH